MPGAGASAQLTAKSVDDSSLLATYTFSKEQTKKLYEIALSAGVPGVVSVCVALAPGWLKAYCPVIGAVLTGLLVANPPNGRCLQAFTKLGFPPVGSGTSTARHLPGAEMPGMALFLKPASSTLLGVGVSG
jgi:hypothetical protein